MAEKEYAIAYGNKFVKSLAIFFHLIVEGLYLLLFNIPIFALMILIYSWLLDIFNGNIPEYILFGGLTILGIFDVVDLAKVIFEKPKVILTDNYLYLKRSFKDKMWEIHRDKIILYNEILSCEETWTEYGMKWWNECFLLHFYDREHEITITTNQKNFGQHRKYIIPLINDQEFLDELAKRVELATQHIMCC